MTVPGSRTGAGGEWHSSHLAVGGAPAPSPSDASALGAEVSSAVAPGLEQLYAEEYPRLVRAARTLVDQRPAAEDIVQEAFARCLARWDEEVPDRGRAYLRATTINLARTHLRRRMMRRPREALAERRRVADWVSDPADDIVVRTARTVLLDGLRALPRRQRECVALHYIADLSIAETADALSVSPSTVKTHLGRGLQTLAGLMGDPTQVDSDSDRGGLT